MKWILKNMIYAFIRLRYVAVMYTLYSYVDKSQVEILKKKFFQWIFFIYEFYSHKIKNVMVISNISTYKQIFVSMSTKSKPRESIVKNGNSDGTVIQ